MTDKQIKTYIDRLIKDRERNVALSYKTALNDVKSKIATLYEKYSSDGVLTYAEMTKYNRLNSLYKSLADDLKDNWNIIDKEYKGLVSDVYNESYYRHGYVIAEDIGININFGLVSKETIYSLYNEPTVSGLSLREILGNTRYNLLLKERQTLIQGFLQGESYADMAKRLNDLYNKSFNDALRIARTEGTRAANEAQVSNLDDAENMGIEIRRVWLSARDSRTRDAHASLNGQVADKEGYFHYNGMTAKGPVQWGEASMDINCRCTVKGEVISENVKKSNINGGDLESYEKWKKEQK